MCLLNQNFCYIVSLLRKILHLIEPHLIVVMVGSHMLVQATHVSEPNLLHAYFTPDTLVFVK